MRVLVGCERSQVVAKAFNERGHEVLSCDLEPAQQDAPHYQGNVFDVMAVLDSHIQSLPGLVGRKVVDLGPAQEKLMQVREAIRELVEADREHDEANASYATAATGKPRNDAWARVLAARQRRAAAIQKFAGV